MIKIGRNDPCPCGSGLKYKYCCIDKKDNPEYFLPDNYAQFYKDMRKEARFKECLYPDHSCCSEQIIKSHSIQNNKILSKISDNGIVYMPMPKPDLSFSFQKEYGRKEASVFTGFCDYHDKTVFQPIEDEDFQATEEQIFLYTYRAFALEYHKKKEVVRSEQFEFANIPSVFKKTEIMINGKTGFGMAVDDYADEKVLFDKALLTKHYDVLTSIVWSFDGFSHFAATGGEAPSLDYDNQWIQNLINPTVPVRHIYYSVFPEKDKTYAIIAWLKEYDQLFASIKEKLTGLSDLEKRNYINYSLPLVTENIAIKPSSWDAWSEEAKEEFSDLFDLFTDIIFDDNGNISIIDRFQKPKFDLFSL